MILLLGSVLLAALIALLAAALRIRSALDHARRESTLCTLLATFGPAVADAQANPLRLLVWYPLATASRALFPDAFQALDRASGGGFPFTKDQVQAAHARWTADWLAWERSHDAEYSVKTAAVEDEIARSDALPSPLLRTRLAAVEREKLERYQQRYEEYIRTAKALAALIES